MGVLLPAVSLLGLQPGAGSREKRLRLEPHFLFILLKCYTDNAAFNYPGGGACLLHAGLSQLKFGTL